jgi:pyruvoyl-dependent arginine decarboxylase (PvlArgDC)
LFKNAQIQARVREIAATAAKRNEVTEDSLIEELEQARLAALEAEQASAAVAATMGKAKVWGLLVERKETGKPGDFDNMTVEELKAFIEADLDSKPATHDGMTQNVEPPDHGNVPPALVASITDGVIK